MNDDELMGQLGEAQTARDDDGLDPRWLELAAGDLAQDEEDALRALAAESEEDAQRWAMFAPLGKAFEGEMAELAMAHVAPPAPLEPTLPEGLRWVAMALTLAVMVGTVVFATSTTPSAPTYELVLTGGEQTLRSEAPPSGPVVLSPGARIEAILRPPSASDVPVEVVAVAQQGDRVVALGFTMESDPKGTVRLTGTLGNEMKLPPGDWALVILLAPKGHLDGWEALLKAPASEQGPIQTFKRPFTVRP